MKDTLARLAVAEGLLAPARSSWAAYNQAVSVAYYALFHHLIDAAVVNALGRERTPEALELRRSMTRWFQHGQMKETARRFSSQTKVPEFLRALLQQGDQCPTGIAPPELVSVARTFLALQDARHLADYDVARRFTRSEAKAHVERVRNALADWSKVAASAPARLFLMLLLVDDRLAQQR